MVLRLAVDDSGLAYSETPLLFGVPATTTGTSVDGVGASLDA